MALFTRRRRGRGHGSHRYYVSFTSGHGRATGVYVYASNKEAAMRAVRRRYSHITDVRISRHAGENPLGSVIAVAAVTAAAGALAVYLVQRFTTPKPPPPPPKPVLDFQVNWPPS
jgi:hypothetical protein